jgi:predicted permease
LQREYRDAYDPGAHYGVAVIPFKEVLGEKARLTLMLLMAAAAFVLIISAANVANLTLMRGVRRERELVVRAALGAGVSRLRRLLLAENLVLTVTGALLGVGIALAGVKLLVSFAERYSPRAGEIQLDAVVLGFMLALSLVLTFLLSFLASLPKESSSSSWIVAGARVTGGLQKQRLQRALVIVQIAVSVVLLAGAGLLTRTLMRLSDVDTGLSTEQVLSMQVSLLSRDEARANKTAAAAASKRFDEVRQEIAALPGVIEVGVGGTPPLRTSGVAFDVKAEGKPVAPGEAQPRAEWRSGDSHYFGASGVPLLQGRVFVDADEPNEDNLAIINKALADKLFAKEDPIGKRVSWTGDLLRHLYPDALHWRTIVGVVGNTRDGDLDAKPIPAMFTPGIGTPVNVVLVIRAGGDMSVLGKTATRVVRATAPDALIEDVKTIQQYKNESVSPRRLNAVLISAFSLLALLIAVVGIGGVLAFSVSARTNEIGIRMSLGADSPRIQRMILGEGGTLLVFGLGLGVLAALFAARAIRGLLFGVEPYDAVTFSTVALLMATIGLAACWIPALRASRIDPATTMRA